MPKTKHGGSRDMQLNHGCIQPAFLPSLSVPSPSRDSRDAFSEEMLGVGIVKGGELGIPHHTAGCRQFGRYPLRGRISRGLASLGFGVRDAEGRSVDVWVPSRSGCKIGRAQ